MSWKKLIEKLICLNRCLFLVTQSPRNNVWHPGFVFLAVLALRSGYYIETWDIYREKHSCRCYVLSELHKTFFSAAQTFCPFSFNHEVEVDVFEHALHGLECCLYGNHSRSSMDCERIRDPRFSIVTCMSVSFRTWLDALGWLAQALFAVIEEHTVDA